MSEKNVEVRQESNKVRVCGIIEEEFEYSHELLLNKFYKTRIKVPRLSGTVDYVPIIVRDTLITKTLKESVKGKFVEVGGKFQSYNKIKEDGSMQLDLFLFVNTINLYQSDEEFQGKENINSIYLEGYICKKPIYRQTPFGRDITDVMLAVNRSYNKSDYIPCIAWGANAMYLSFCDVGDKIRLYGRIQSREYFKRYNPASEEGESRTAYEISIISVAKVKDEISDD